MPLPFFKDLNKRVSDLTTKDFPSEQQENKIEWKSTTLNNVTFETHLVQKKDGSVVGTFIPKYNLKDWGTTFSVEVNTKKELKVETVVENKFAEGLKTTTSVQSKLDNLTSTLSIDYKHDLATLSLHGNFTKGIGSILKAASVIGFAKNGSMGASVEYFLGNTHSGLREFCGNLNYNAEEFDVSIFGRMKNLGEEEKQEVGASYFHKLNNNLSVGTEIVLDVPPVSTKPKLTLASQYVIEKDSIIKGKFDTDGKIGFSLQQRLNKNVKGTLSTTIDSNNLDRKSVV